MSNSGAAIDNIVYDARGNVTSQSNSAQQPKIGFTGLLTFAALGVDAADVRIYDPQSGQWMQQDPLLTQAGPNTREYVNDIPTNATDPTGMASEPVLVAKLKNLTVPDFGARPEGVTVAEQGYS